MLISFLDEPPTYPKPIGMMNAWRQNIMASVMFPKHPYKKRMKSSVSVSLGGIQMGNPLDKDLV